MPPGPIELGGRRALVLGFDPEAAGLPPLSGPGAVVVLTRDGALSRDLRRGLDPSARVASFAGAASGDGVAVVHTLFGTRLLPTIAAIRAGVRTFHLVDAPGSSFRANARGALTLALKRAVARLLLRSPLRRLAESAVGHRLDCPWPSATATLRAIEAARRAATPAPGPVARSVHWLAALDAHAEDSLSLIALLVPRLRALGVAVEVLAPQPTRSCEAARAARVRSLERLGASCAFLPRPTWKPRAERPRLPGLPPALVRDLEDHVHADLLLPLLTHLLERPAAAAVVHGWLDPGLESASVVGLAGVLARAQRVLLHASGGAPASSEADDLSALCVRRLAETSPKLELLAPGRAAARDLAAWAGLAPERVHAVPVAAVPEPRLPAPERALRRRLMGFPEGAFVVVATGDLGEGSGSRLVGIARGLLGESGDALVLHVGPNDAEARLRAVEASLGPRLRLLGDAPDRDEYLRLADAVLALDPPARAAQALARTLAFGAPVVVASGSEEGFEDGASGLLLARGDAAAASRHLLRLEREARLRPSPPERARTTVHERFAPERFVEVVLESYRPAAPA